MVNVPLQEAGGWATVVVHLDGGLQLPMTILGSYWFPEFGTLYYGFNG